MNVTLRQLRLFRQISRDLNFSRAGDVMGLSQPAVSHAIGELESQLGLKLLDRTTREVALTDAGKTLAGQLERLLDDLDQALHDVVTVASAHGGRVRIGSSPSLSAALMPACIAACQAEAPEIRLILLDRVQEDVLQSVRNGDVDMGMVVEPSFTDDLHCEVLMHDPFVLVASAGHALARRRSVPWSALEGQALVLLDQSSGSRRLIDQALSEQGVTCQVLQEVGYPATVFRMVERGIGSSVMPGLSVPDATDGVVIKPLSPRVERRIMLIRRKSRTLSPAAHRVWELVRRSGSRRG